MKRKNTSDAGITPNHINEASFIEGLQMGGSQLEYHMTCEFHAKFPGSLRDEKVKMGG